MLILIRWFDVNWKEGAKILNACFPNAAVPFACRMVQSYWRDMRKKADKVWVYVYEKVSFTSPDHEVQSIMDKLMQVATKTGFTLKFRHAEDLAKPISPLSTSFRRNERSQRSQTHFLPVYEQQPDDIEGCNEEIPLANFKSEESNVVNLEPEDTLDLDEICQSCDISSDEPPMNTPIYSQEGMFNRSLN
jgi:hypothetical protein